MALAAPLVLMTACKSLPLPDTPEKSLLVLATDVKLVDKDKSRHTLSFTLEMSRVNDKKAFTVSFLTSARYATVPLDPGTYVINTAVVHNNWYGNGQWGNPWDDRHNIGRRVYIEPKSVILYDSLFYFHDNPNPDTGYFITMNMSAMVNDIGTRILAAMKKDRHWQAWEGYALVNFPEEKAQ